MIKNFFRNIKYAIKNLLYYFPIIIKDRDWSHEYILDLLEHKLKKMQKSISEQGIGCHQTIGKIYDEMEVVLHCLEQLREDDFYKDEDDAFQKKWGPAKMVFLPIPGDPHGCSTMRILRPFVTNAKEEEQASKEQMDIYKLGDKRKRETIEKLFSELSKNIENWWD